MLSTLSTKRSGRGAGLPPRIFMDKMTISLFWRLCYTSLINHVNYRYYGKRPGGLFIHNVLSEFSPQGRGGL